MQFFSNIVEYWFGCHRSAMNCIKSSLTLLIQSKVRVIAGRPQPMRFDRHLAGSFAEVVRVVTEPTFVARSHW